MILTCPICQKEFYRKPSYVEKVENPTCSYACMAELKRKPRKTLICDCCEEEYEVLPSTVKWNKIREHKHNFCSTGCRDKFYAEKKRKRVSVTCANCDEEFHIVPAEYRDRKKRAKTGLLFCSSECQYEHFSGENSPVWVGDRDKRVGRPLGNKKAKEWTKKVLSRDDYTCQLCGLRAHEGLGRRVRLVAHHIKRWADYPELRYEASNGATLCYKCHQKTKGHEEGFEKKLLQKIKSK